MAKAPTRYQYDPPVTPEKWDDAGKRFAIRVTSLLATLFQRQGESLTEMRAIKERLQTLENSLYGGEEE